MTVEVAHQLQNTHTQLKEALQNKNMDYALEALEWINNESIKEAWENYVKWLELNKLVWNNQSECCDFINMAFEDITLFKNTPLPKLVLLEV